MTGSILAQWILHRSNDRRAYGILHEQRAVAVAQLQRMVACAQGIDNHLILQAYAVHAQHVVDVEGRRDGGDVVRGIALLRGAA